MKYHISPRQLKIMQELQQLDVPLTRISTVAGIPYHAAYAALQNGKGVAPRIFSSKQKRKHLFLSKSKDSLEDILHREKKRHPSFAKLFLSQKDIDKVARTKEGIEKIVALAAESDWLAGHSFTPSHCYKIVRAGGEWREKLEWIVQNYQNILKPLGFNGSHVAQIVTNAGWDKKLEWITENYQNILKPLGFNGSHVAKIVTNAGWDKKLEWITENYQEVQQYGLTPGRVAFFFKAENWQRLTTHWTANVKSLPELRIFDTEISPLTESYLFHLIFEGVSATEIYSLRAKCTAKDVDKFAELVQRLSGKNGIKNLPEIMADLQQHGYSELEVGLYLKAMNKNRKGLVRWYNTGEKYTLPTVVFDDSQGYTEDHAVLPAEMAEKKDALQKYIERAAATEQEKIFWGKVIVEYEGDIERLDVQERNMFEQLTTRMRKDKPLMAELYDLLKP